MTLFFIADIHLSENEPVIKAGFLSFLSNLPAKCELYILGDLFDYWVGDDVQAPLYQEIAYAISQLSEKQIRTYFVVGNRDFLLGKLYADLCKMTLLPDINCLSASGDRRSISTNQHILFLHGDLLCTDDKVYQKFRKVIHNKWLQKLFLLLPLCIRKKIANKLRNKSQTHNQIKPLEIMDVNQQAVENIMTLYHARILIHGHTHKPASHKFIIDNQIYERIVLGAWHHSISYIEYDEATGQIGLHSQSFR